LPAEERDFSLLRRVETGSGCHPACYPSSTPEGDTVVKLTTPLYLVPRLTMVEPYIRSPICLHGTVLIYVIKNRDKITFNMV
jgi:hypothetical protein